MNDLFNPVVENVLKEERASTQTISLEIHPATIIDHLAMVLVTLDPEDRMSNREKVLRMLSALGPFGVLDGTHFNLVAEADEQLKEYK